MFLKSYSGTKRFSPLEISELLETVTQVNKTLEKEQVHVRPKDATGEPGGLVELFKDLPTFIIPDLHGRSDFILRFLDFQFQGERITTLLGEGKIQVVCLGDGIHVEYKVSSRWREAFEEYREEYKESPAMDQEIRESFSAISLIWELKNRFPDHFHFLKGNHENITNENSNGNHSFIKFAMEGDMTRSYVLRFFGKDFLHKYSRFEKSLPILAKGRYFVASHAQPRSFYDKASIINYRSNPQVIEGLTWTQNGASPNGTVKQMMTDLLGSATDSNWWISGHRPINRLYRIWPDEQFIQIHNPAKYVVALFDVEKNFTPETSVFELI